MRIQWNPKAREDRLQHIAYIRQHNPQAALNNDRRIQDYAIKLLSEKITCKTGRVPGTYEIVVSKSHIIVYRIKGEIIEILRVLHTSQDPLKIADLLMMPGIEDTELDIPQSLDLAQPADFT